MSTCVLKKADAVHKLLPDTGPIATSNCFFCQYFAPSTFSSGFLNYRPPLNYISYLLDIPHDRFSFQNALHRYYTSVLHLPVHKPMVKTFQ